MMKHYLFTLQNPLQSHQRRDHHLPDQHTIPIGLNLDLVDLLNRNILPNTPGLAQRSRRPGCINRNLRNNHIFRNNLSRYILRNMDKMGSITNNM
jgi:hypothetical protein